MPAWLRTVGSVVLLLIVIGIVANVLYGGFGTQLWKHGQSANWAWWQYVIAIPVIGFVALVAEGIGTAIFAFSEKTPRWSRAFRVIFAIGIVIAITGVIALVIWMQQG